MTADVGESGGPFELAAFNGDARGQSFYPTYPDSRELMNCGLGFVMGCPCIPSGAFVDPDSLVKYREDKRGEARQIVRESKEAAKQAAMADARMRREEERKRLEKKHRKQEETEKKALEKVRKREKKLEKKRAEKEERRMKKMK